MKWKSPGLMYERIGVTGPRRGINQPQLLRLGQTLQILRDSRGAKYFHHGQCIGGDVQAAKVAKLFGYRIISHPPINEQFLGEFESDETRDPGHYRERDRELVDEVELLIAMPDGFLPKPRSGTWYTAGYAKKIGRPTVYLWPDGSWSA